VICPPLWTTGVIAVGQLCCGESAIIGQGQLVDPRALAVAVTGEKTQLFVADAGTNTIKVFEAFVLSAEFTGHGSSHSQWISDFPGLQCPVGLAVTSQGHLVVLCHSNMGEAVGSLVLLDSSGQFRRQIVPDLRFDPPFTIECDSSDHLALLHRYFEPPTVVVSCLRNAMPDAEACHSNQTAMFS